MLAVFRRTVLLIVATCSIGWSAAPAADVNRLTAHEKKLGFRLLFNGCNLEGWRHSGNWTTINGCIVCAKRGDSLVCTGAQLPASFELSFQWSVAPPKDPHAQDATDTRIPDGSFVVEQQWPISETDATGTRRLWGRVGYYFATDPGRIGVLSETVFFGAVDPKGAFFSQSPNKAASYPSGHWNTGRIVWSGERFQHWINGNKVVDTAITAPRSEPEYLWQRARQNNERLLAFAAQCRKQGLHIEFEDGDPSLSYRAVKLRELKVTSDRATGLKKMSSRTNDPDEGCGEEERGRLPPSNAGFKD